MHRLRFGGGRRRAESFARASVDFLRLQTLARYLEDGGLSAFPYPYRL
jgi:hypothetical protein